MARTTNKTSNSLRASAVLMLLALLWLTVSMPFVYASQQQVAMMEKAAGEQVEKNLNPLAGTNEEKSETGIGALSEYLHEMTLPEAPFVAPLVFEKCHPSDLYFAYHPELLCPPPNRA